MSKIFYAMDSEADGLLHEVTKIHCFGFKGIDHSDFFVFCRLNELDKYKRAEFEQKGIQFFQLDRVVDFFKSQKVCGFSVHNGLSYDYELIKMFYGIDYDWRGFKGYNHVLEDTYVESMYLFPDRQLPKNCPSSVKYIDKDGNEKNKKIGPHGLESWGYRTGTHKPFIDDWRDQPLDIYVNRVIHDCIIQEATHFALQKEIQDVALPNGSKQGQWKLPLAMAHKTYWLMQEQERCGVKFDVEGAKKLVERIDKEMKEIEDDVEPRLGMRSLPMNSQPKFPSSCFRKAFDYDKPYTSKGGLKKPVKDYLNLIGITENQEEYLESLCDKEDIDGVTVCRNNIEEKLPKHPDYLTEAAKNWCLKFGIEDIKEQFDEICKYLGCGDEYPRLLEEPMRLANQDDIKNFFIQELNWEPTLWRTKNLLVDLKTKQAYSKEDQEEKIKKYIRDVQTSSYKKFILKILGYKKEPDYESQSFYNVIKKNGRSVPSSPQLKDISGNLCPNLEKLEAVMAKQIVKWLSLRNRRTTIKSFDKNTGWLNNERLKIDGRLPGASTGLTNTKRQKHYIICNIPAASDDVLLGKEVRDLFIAPKGYCCVGADCSGIEGRCMGEAAWNFDNGEFANIVLNGDIHCYTDDTEILTLNGWKLFKDLSQSDEVAEYNDNGTINFVIPSEIIKSEYNGDIINFNNKSVSLSVTPNHRMISFDCRSKSLFVETALDFPVHISSRRIAVCGKYKNNGYELSVDLVRLIVAIQADGSYETGIRFEFMKQTKIELLRNCLNSLNIKFSEKISRRGTARFYIPYSEIPKDIDTYLNKEKNFTYAWIKTSYKTRELFLKELVLWDGWNYKNRSFYSQSEKRFDSVHVVQTVALLNNRRTFINTYKHVLRVSFNTEIKTTLSDIFKADKMVTKYKGFIYCVSVNSGMVVVRKNNKVVVCGNSNNADAFSKVTGNEITRKNAKSPFYAGIYGCSGKKQATLLGVDEELGDEINDALWNNALGLKKCREALEQYWESTGKKYIMGITGEKVYIRNKHSVLNAFLQNADACLMDWACCYIYDKIKEEELDAKRWIFVHDELNHYQNIKELSYELFNIDNKPDEDRNGKKYSKPKLFRDGKILHYGLPKGEDPLPTDQWLQHYSRVGEICVEGMKKAGQFFKFRVPLDGQYICGRSWGHTH